ncbi:PilN domain-containing protein [Gluconacetobacter takamatsuzukensis]|uniref:PilN domain-containing protein n=1 Tax=Gluconacetobacter takamatsuzukensis TaxID=1286190 RepID=A0A7W4KEB1_9PROT|nr:PilN domain-containing protein [Gluconacetobacter takamatsuzukensis]MBB2205319.1 PilN domain-containing protein [Gluconacetobacter takamatsuzukensis]
MTGRLLFAWWWRQIRSLIPERIRSAQLSSRPRLVAAWTGQSLTLSLERQGGQTSLGTLGQSEAGDAETQAACQPLLAGRSHPPETILRLPPGMIMQREVTLPAATETGLDGALAYEMDRLTPFSADTIFYSHTIVRRDAAPNQVRILLSLVLRTSVAPALHMLAPLGIQPDRLEDATRSMHIPLKTNRSPWRSLQDPRTMAAAGAALLPAMVIVLLFWRQSTEQAALSARIAALRPAALEATMLRRQAEDRRAGETIIAATRRQWGDPMAVLAATTQMLPDTSFLTDLSLRQGQLIISGQSPEATGLIQVLSRTPMFRNPAFVAPVTRVTGQNASVFSIRADVGQ